MKVRGCQVFLLVAVSVNVIILIYLAQVQHTFDPQQDSQIPTRDISAADITVLIVEFESFQQDLSSTIKSFLAFSSKIHFVIVSKELPYPPLDIPDKEQIKLIVQEDEPDKPLQKPESIIKTKYVLIIQDSTRLLPGTNIGPMISVLEETSGSPVHVVVTPVSGREPLLCQGLQVDLRQWTLTYSKMGPFEKVCDSVSSSGAILMKTADLLNLPEPFMRPLTEALFIQTSLRGWKVKIVSTPLFLQGSKLFTDEHNRWKHDQRENQRLTTMYKRFGIKKVVRDQNQGGKVALLGCNKNTPRCFGTVVDDMPDYIYRGRWTPPCCLGHLRETAQHVFSILDQSGVQYWLEGGSLLGAARSGDIIPWDYDADVGIYQKELHKCSYLAQILANPGVEIKDEKDFVWSKAREGDFFRVQYSQINHLHVDIFPFYERDGIMTKDFWLKTHRQDTEFPAKYLQPLTTIDFAGYRASAPNNVREFLELKFGKGVIENPQYPNPKKYKKNPSIG